MYKIQVVLTNFEYYISDGCIFLQGMDGEEGKSKVISVLNQKVPRHENLLYDQSYNAMHS